MVNIDIRIDSMLLHFYSFDQHYFGVFFFYNRLLLILCTGILCIVSLLKVNDHAFFNNYFGNFFLCACFNIYCFVADFFFPTV